MEPWLQKYSRALLHPAFGDTVFVCYNFSETAQNSPSIPDLWLPVHDILMLYGLLHDLLTNKSTKKPE